jgi:hypothetical protein
MRWFVGTAGVFMWTGLLVSSVSAQRSNIDASLREAIGEIDKRPVIATQATTVKRASPAPDQSRTDGTLPSREQLNNGTVTIITAPVGGAYAAMAFAGLYRRSARGRMTCSRAAPGRAYRIRPAWPAGSSSTQAACGQD